MKLCKVKKYNKILIATLVAAATLTAGCNKKDADQEPTSTSASTQVSAFSLKDDIKVAPNLSKVHFTIDLDKREIYNADSLPKGTNVTALTATITYPTMTSVEIYINNGSKAGNATINYGKNSNDSIDFTGDVSLVLKSQDGEHQATYSLKVNVHKMEPDSLYWPETARRDLPVIAATAQRTVMMDDKYITFARTASGYSVATTTDLPAENWQVKSVALDFEPDVASLTSSPEKLYMLATDGSLYESADGVAWTACGNKFHSLLGCYEEMLLAVVEQGGAYYCIGRDYDGSLTEAKSLPKGFPIEDFSAPVFYETLMGYLPTMLIHGGRNADGNLSGDTWAFDGNSWAKLTEDHYSAPEVMGAILLPYFTFNTSNTWVVTRYATLFAIGGINAKGEATKTVYISRDNGVHWQKAESLLQLPSYIPAMGYAQPFVVNQYKGIDWAVPYIYLFGGTDASGKLFNNVWKGAINRLTFQPII